MKRNGRSGFTLVELAIVLVIIGLIVGGVLVGQDLVRVAELRNIIADKERYDAAVNTFRNKYNALPGDMRNATDIWGAADADFTDCKTTQGTGTQTCNGNGDGVIANTQLPDTEADNYEMYRAWQQMANANLVKGSYTGIGGAGGADEALIGENIPSTAFSGLGMNLFWIPRIIGEPELYDGNYNHVFILGAEIPTMYAMAPAMRPSDAYYIDSKVDNGAPATGRVRGPKQTSNIGPGCTTADDATAQYNLSSNANLCQLVMRASF